ncbi:MAG: hypothetical protein LBI48_13075 [Burkholderiaceae bacterium]|nr:hypothetical protein [Burkholderiaceae bacterium]
MTCPACAAATHNPASGQYRFACLGCCARLVASARPSRCQQETMLAAIARYPGAHGRDAILESARLIPKKRR